MISIELDKNRNYNIFIDEDWNWESVLQQLAGRSCYIITDQHVNELYLNTLKTALPNILGQYVVLPGESSKSLEMAKEIFGDLISSNANRKTVIIALGGGVVGDLAGFVASTYMRGVPFFQIPTTLLSMVDSSVGGKVAVNHPLGKNMIGSFYQPEGVWISLNCLKTLPKREISAGLAEVIKYGIIWDAQFFNWLESNIDALLNLSLEELQHAITISVQIKAKIVKEDETESSGLRSLLNLGHTFGHAEEVLVGYGKILHGEAVAAGIVAASRVSHHLEKMDISDLNKVIHLIQKASLPIRLNSIQDFDKFWDVMKNDKKAEYGNIHFVIPEKIGTCQFPKPLPKETIQEAILP